MNTTKFLIYRDSDSSKPLTPSTATLVAPQPLNFSHAPTHRH
ncbi:MAG: hypothetical protein ACH346_02715 [Chthoniobacterales bacterium]